MTECAACTILAFAYKTHVGNLQAVADAMRASVWKMLLVCCIAGRMFDPECLCSEVSTNAWGMGCRPTADAARAGGWEDPRVPGRPLAHQARRRRLQDGSLLRRAPAAGGGREHLSRGAGSGCGDGDDQKFLFFRVWLHTCASFDPRCMCYRASCRSFRSMYVWAGVISFIVRCLSTSSRQWCVRACVACAVRLCTCFGSICAAGGLPWGLAG